MAPVPEMTLGKGVRLHCGEAGVPAKPRVVWIHGGSIEDSSSMVADLEPFGARIRALFPDTRGHGLSARFERVEDYTYPKKAEDVLLWLDALGIGRAVFGGASMGGALSLWLAAHVPERGRAVVSISGPPYAPPPEDIAWWRRHRPLVEAGRFEEYYDANVRLRVGGEALARLKARPDRYVEVLGTLRLHSVASLLALLDETYARTEWLADCARIRAPVLIVSGSADHFPTVAMSRRGAPEASPAPPPLGGGGPPLPTPPPPPPGPRGS